MDDGGTGVTKDWHWRWASNIALAALNVAAFVDTPRAALIMTMGAALGFIFAYDALRGRP